MKILLAAFTCTLAACVMVPDTAGAAPSTVTSYVFYNGTVPVGQTIKYCDGKSTVWGDTSPGMANAVGVSYDCETRQAIHVGYPASIDPWVRDHFCQQTDICAVGPSPIIDQ
jgi:hypothetical protein